MTMPPRSRPITEDHSIPVRSANDLHTISDRLTAARGRGIRVATVLIGAESHELLRDVAKVVRPLQRKLRGIRIAMEGVGGPGGRIDLPADLTGVDDIHVRVDRVAIAGAELGPMELREALECGRTSALEIIRALGERWCEVLDAKRPVVVRHPFALLEALGIPEHWVPGPVLERMAERLVRSSGGVLLEEASRSPRPESVRVLFESGATVLIGTGARFALSAGRYEYVDRTLRRLYAPKGLFTRVA